MARPRARPRPLATWRQEASIPAEEKKKEWKEREHGGTKAGKKDSGGSRCERRNEDGLRGVGTGFEKVAALSLPEDESPLSPGFGDGSKRERTRQRNGPRVKEHPAPKKENRGGGKGLLGLRCSAVTGELQTDPAAAARNQLR